MCYAFTLRAVCVFVFCSNDTRVCVQIRVFAYEKRDRKKKWKSGGDSGSTVSISHRASRYYPHFADWYSYCSASKANTMKISKELTPFKNLNTESREILINVTKLFIKYFTTLFFPYILQFRILCNTYIKINIQKFSVYSVTEILSSYFAIFIAIYSHSLTIKSRERWWDYNYSRCE